MDASLLTDELTPERLDALATAFPWPAEQPVVSLPDQHLDSLDVGVRELLGEELSQDTRLIVELGAWFGLITRFLADRAPNAKIAAVEHWLDSPEYHRRREWQALLPTLHSSFLARCWPYRDRIIPLRLTNLMALQLLADYRLPPELIYFDAEHTYQAILSELELSGRLFPQAIFVGDDYPHPPICNAVNEFARRHRLGVRNAGNGWKIQSEQGGRR